MPSLGNAFIFLAYGGVSSYFGGVNLPSTGFLWQENYGAAGLTLTATNLVVPVVNILSPANNTVFTAPTNIAILAVVTNNYTAISKVDFYQENYPLGEDLLSETILLMSVSVSAMG